MSYHENHNIDPVHQTGDRSAPYVGVLWHDSRSHVRRAQAVRTFWEFVAVALACGAVCLFAFAFTHH